MKHMYNVLQKDAISRMLIKTGLIK